MGFPCDSEVLGEDFEEHNYCIKFYIASLGSKNMCRNLETTPDHHLLLCTLFCIHYYEYIIRVHYSMYIIVCVYALLCILILCGHRKVWEEKPLLLRRHRPNYNQGWFSTSDLDTILRKVGGNYLTSLPLHSLPPHLSPWVPLYLSLISCA